MPISRVLRNAARLSNELLPQPPTGDPVADLYIGRARRALRPIISNDPKISDEEAQDLINLARREIELIPRHKK